MSKSSTLLEQFLSAKTGEDIRRLLLKEGDFSEDVALNEVFGDGLVWLPVGGRTTNVSTIELATHPGRSIVERVNNSIDALIEAELMVTPQRERPQTPTQAAGFTFGRPSDPIHRVEWFDEIGANAEANRLSVVMLNGESREQPRLDVFDGGAGILANDFANTILSLNVENKIKVPHALGMFGQGGSSSFAFASHTLILSRSHLKPGQIGFTVVRRCEIRGWKESCYA